MTHTQIYDEGGILVNSTVTVSWFSLGSGFTQQDSTQQKDFLLGVSDRFQRMGHEGQMQLAYLADEFNDLERAVTITFLEDLVAHIKLGTDKPRAKVKKK